jgi:hypothetical protein
LADYVSRAVAEAVAEGLDPEETRQRVDVGAWRRSFVGDDPVLGRYFDLWYTTPAVERRFAEVSRSDTRAGRGWPGDLLLVVGLRRVLSRPAGPLPSPLHARGRERCVER